MAAYKAFREPDLVSEPEGGAFEDFDSRRLRYAVFWAFFENTAYRNVHSWAVTYRVQHGLYRYTRNIYNPSYRLATFWQTHLMGGHLDPAAGDGKMTPTALPILTDNEALRPAIARLWQDSNWGISKEILTLQGTVFGDTALEVVDDPDRKKVYLRVVNPSTLAAVTLDPFGNVKGYTIEEGRTDEKGQQAAYRETAERDGDGVVYRTYRNGRPYGWDGSPAQWREEYGFVPLVVVQHYNVGLQWGWSELHAGRGKFAEVDDLASKLSDQIRKIVDAPWLMSGVQAPTTTKRTTSRDSKSYQETDAAGDRPQPGREEIPMVYGPAGAQATPLVAPLDIAGTYAYIQGILEDLERDYPELQADMATASGDASGRALRVARQRAESKVRMRRESYDNALVRAQQMAVAIGGYRGYEGYQGFGLDSYAAGALDHAIGKRPVFAQDPLDDTEIETAFWTTANEAIKAGIPLRLYLRDKGWTEEQMAALDRAIDEEDKRRAANAPAWMLGAAQEQPESEEEAPGGEE